MIKINLEFSQSVLLVDNIPDEDMIILQQHLRQELAKALSLMRIGYIDVVDMSQQSQATEARIRAYGIITKGVDSA